MQEILQLGDDLHEALVGVEPLGTLVFVDLVLADVALGELEELLLVATLGDGDRHAGIVLPPGVEGQDQLLGA